MKKIYITNDTYAIDKELDNHKIVKVDYLFKGYEVVKYYAYDIDASKDDAYYLNLAKLDFHKFTKTKGSICYSRYYLFKESKY